MTRPAVASAGPSCPWKASCSRASQGSPAFTSELEKGPRLRRKRSKSKAGPNQLLLSDSGRRALGQSQSENPRGKEGG